MKKGLLLFAMTIMVSAIFAQDFSNRNIKDTTNESKGTLSPLATAPDFTVTFTDGTRANLFEALSAGNSVVLDFFYVDCQYCQMGAPIIEQSYVNHGSGAGNIKYWGIDNGDNNAAVISYKSEYGVTNPCASGNQGGANAVVSAYGVQYYPLYAVVCPDKTINFDVNYGNSGPTVTGFNSYFASCGTTAIEEDAEETMNTAITYMYPMPAIDNVNIHVFVDNASVIKIELFDLMGNAVYSTVEHADKGYYNSAISVANLAAGAYMVKLVQDNNVVDVQKVMVVK